MTSESEEVEASMTAARNQKIHLNSNNAVREKNASGDETGSEGLDNNSREGLFINEDKHGLVKIPTASVKVETQS